MLLRLTILNILALIGGWCAYGLSLLLYGESPFQSDVVVVGFWALLFGFPFLFALAPIFLIIKNHLSRGMLSVIAVCISFGYMSLIIGLPTIPETLLFHIFAAVSSLIFSYGFPWVIVEKTEQKV